MTDIELDVDGVPHGGVGIEVPVAHHAPKRIDELKCQVIVLVVALVFAVGAPGKVQALEKQSMDVTAIVKTVMNQAYGETYDPKNDCWAFPFKDDQGESIDYCMRPGKSSVVSGPEGQTMYLWSFSVSDIRGAARYGYALVQPGLMGAFKIHLREENTWKYDAVDKAMYYGTGGDCGCSKARFVQLDSAGQYGWIFVSGGTWQGVTVADFSIITAIGRQIKDVSEIPHIRELDQDVTYELSVGDDPSIRGMRPLHIKEVRTGTVADEFDVAFDAHKAVYALPAER